MSQLQYLTVQDVLWINQQIRRKAENFEFARLEEAVFYQYALGSNAGLIPQATQLLTGFVKMKPFVAGNEGTAFIACAAFLRLNGKILTVSADDVSKWLAAGGKHLANLESSLVDAPEDEHLDVKTAVQTVLETYGESLGAVAPSS